MNNPSFFISFDFRLFYMICLLIYSLAKLRRNTENRCNHIKEFVTYFTFRCVDITFLYNAITSPKRNNKQVPIGIFTDFQVFFNLFLLFLAIPIIFH